MVREKRSKNLDKQDLKKIEEKVSINMQKIIVSTKTKKSNQMRKIKRGIVFVRKKKE